MDEYAEKVESNLKDSIKTKVDKAKAFLTESMGNADFKDIIKKGLAED